MASRATDAFKCEFCGAQICEFFADVDASRFIRSAIMTHFAYCRERNPDFTGHVLLVYADAVVEAYRRRREIRSRRSAVNGC